MPRRATILFTVYLGYLILLAVTPFTIVVDDSVSLIGLYQAKFEGFSSIFELTVWDIWTNVVLFIPYGAIILSLPALFGYPRSLQILLASVSAGLFSFLLESAQLLVPRRPSLADIVCNMLGAAMGATLSVLASSRLAAYSRERLAVFRKRAPSGVLLGGYLVVLCGVFTVPLPLYFSNWDPDFPFLLGNETNLNRPWRGDIYLVAVYDRALNAKEVRRNFAAGPFIHSSEGRVSEGLVVFYDFSEGEGEAVHDRVSLGSPVHLKFHDPGLVHWLKPNGLSLRGDTILASTQPPLKLSSGRFSDHSELSVEAWIVPANLSQGGPARIVSYSKDVNHRNFTLGQQRRDIAFRLRTPVSGSNGTRPELRTADHPLRLGVQHVVVTFRDGTETLYVDGTEQGRESLETKVALIDVVVSLLGQEFKWPLWSIFLFPLGILSYLFHAGRERSRRVVGIALITASAGMAFTTVVRLVSVKVVDPDFVVIGMGSLVISVMVSLLFVTAGERSRRPSLR